MERTNLKNAKRPAIIFNGLTFTLIIIFIISFVIDLFFMPGLSIIILLGPIAGIGIGLFLRYIIKKKGKTKDDGIFYAVVGIITAVVILQIWFLLNLLYILLIQDMDVKWSSLHIYALLLLLLLQQCF